MKKAFLIIFVLFGFSLLATAQKTTDKAVIKTPAAQCDACKDKIEKYLFRAQGVTSVKVDIKKRTTTVTWIKDRTNIENIKTEIANIGFDADDVTAEPGAYAKLPPCCKNAEPGEKVKE